MKRKFLIFRAVIEAALALLLPVNAVAGVVSASERGAGRAVLRGCYIGTAVMIWLSVLLLLDAERLRKSLLLPPST